MAGLWVALAALALRLAVPTGFMLAADDHNRLTVVICSGQGAQTATLDLATGKLSPDQAPEEGRNAAADAPCAVAAIVVAAIAPGDVTVAAPFARTIGISPLPPHAVRPGRTAAGPPLPPRGPPQYA